MTTQQKGASPRQFVPEMVAYYQKHKRAIKEHCQQHGFPPEQFRIFREEILQRMAYRNETIKSAIDAVLERIAEHAYLPKPASPRKFHPNGMANTGDWQSMIAKLNKGEVSLNDFV